jgi:NAD(P)-dependent dehydrogenase (short-subunit alcohol dehydrogenase family)
MKKKHAGSERKHAVITCDSQGLGLAMVEALASCGGNVTAIGRIVDWAEYGGLF